MKTSYHLTAFLFAIAFFLSPAFFCAQIIGTGYHHSQTICLDNAVYAWNPVSVAKPGRLIALDGNCSE
jgi:hypothetical protein